MFILTIQECSCQHFSKISLHKISTFETAHLRIILLLYHRSYVYTVYIALVYLVSYILVQSEEGYSLIWKAKPLTIQTDKDKW